MLLKRSLVEVSKRMLLRIRKIAVVWLGLPFLDETRQWQLWHTDSVQDEEQEVPSDSKRPAGDMWAWETATGQTYR